MRLALDVTCINGADFFASPRKSSRSKSPKSRRRFTNVGKSISSKLPSRAEGCGGLPPIAAHPELLQPRRPFQSEHELASFDLKRVDAYLAALTWQRKVGKTGQITLGRRHQYYMWDVPMLAVESWSASTRRTAISFSSIPSVPKKKLDAAQLKIWMSPT